METQVHHIHFHQSSHLINHHSKRTVYVNTYPILSNLNSRIYSQILIYEHLFYLNLNELYSHRYINTKERISKIRICLYH
jgi:hypothetical protein